MDTESIVAAYREEGRNLAWGGEILERLPTVTRRTNPNGGRNEVIAFALDSANVGEAIREQVAHFDRLGCSFEWKVASFDSPVDLAQRLEAAGFSVGPLEKVVVYAIEQVDAMPTSLPILLRLGFIPIADTWPCEYTPTANA